MLLHVYLGSSGVLSSQLMIPRPCTGIAGSCLNECMDVRVLWWLKGPLQHLVEVMGPVVVGVWANGDAADLWDDTMIMVMATRHAAVIALCKQSISNHCQLNNQPHAPPIMLENPTSMGAPHALPN